MTNEEAIEFLKNNGCDECTSGFLTPDTCKIDRCELKCAVEKAVEALEKQIPKKPRWKAGYPYCEVCGARLRHTWVGGLAIGDDFCGNCGQAIDWSEDDD